MIRTVITIGRECGSGGRMLGKQLARSLSIPFYDKELIEIAAKETGLSPEFIRAVEECKTASILYNLYYSSQNLPVADQVYLAESDIILRLAGEGPCVIVGRCADYVLRDHENCLHVFLHASEEYRACRVQREYGVEGSRDDALRFVQKKDKFRAAYYRHNTNRLWGDCRNYHLAINCELGEAVVLEVLRECAERRNNL